jgi:hypothetical protein
MYHPLQSGWETRQVDGVGEDTCNSSSSSNSSSRRIYLTIELLAAAQRQIQHWPTQVAYLKVHLGGDGVLRSTAEWVPLPTQQHI